MDVQKRLNPLELIDLRKAVTARKKTVEMQGKKFDLRYKKKQVWFQPSGKIFGTPCGWVDIEWLVKGRFLDDTD